MKISIFILIFILGLFSCKDYLNLVPKNQRVVLSVEDVKSELLAYWAGHTYAFLPLPAYGPSALSLPFYNDINAQLCLYEDNLDVLRFKDHSDINAKCMNLYYEDVDWKGISLASSIWINGYASIGFMNSIIDDLANMSPTKVEFETINGEAKLIRAWNIFKLLQFFAPYGDDKLGIPLNLSSENTTPSGRYSQTYIYDVIIKEVEEVASYTSASEKWNFFYTPDFIKSFLAEVYMFRAGSAAAKDSDWEMAEKYSEEVIASYIPEDNAEVLTDLFSAENISYATDNPYCALKLATGRFCNVGNQFTGIWGLNNAQQVGEELWSLYDESDIRRKAWFKETDVNGLIAKYIAKPVVSRWGPVIDILVLYRKADLYLLNAEAKCRQGNETDAAKMLKTFRMARIPDYKEQAEMNVLDEILKERRKELCFEYGSRWLDMKRLGVTCTREGYSKEDEDVQIYTLKADDYRYALPIPTDVELDYNNISQNPGWTSFN